MTKQKLINSKLYFFCILLISSALIFFGCRKIDTIPIKELPDDWYERFFQIPANATPAVIKVIQDLKKKDSIQPFAKKFATSEGFPLWQYAKVEPVKYKGNVLGRGLEENNDSIVEAPVVRVN